MYKKIKATRTSLSINDSIVGESIEAKIARMLKNGEGEARPVDLIFTERKMGILPDYNIRTDRMEAALEAMDKVSKSKIMARQERQRKWDDEKTKVPGNQGGQSTPQPPGEPRA